MGDTRIVYGLAYGKQGNWYTTWQAKTHGVLAQASTAPDVTEGVLFYTVNSASTTISDFKLRVAGSPDTGGNIAPLFEGKVVKVFFTDGNTTVANNARIFLSSSTNTVFPANSWLGLVYHNSAWYETERSVATESGRVMNISIAGTNNAATIDGNVSTLVVTGTTVLQVLSGISGGNVGQRVTIVQGSGGALITINTAGNLYVAGTNAFNIAVADSQNAVFGVIATKVSASAWAIVR